MKIKYYGDKIEKSKKAISLCFKYIKKYWL